MFSVIIPLYNKSSYIKKAVKSVLGQTYVDLELIIINDGSTDDSVEKIKCIKDQRLKIIGQSNLGVATARNNGVKVAKYNYITFLDADDWWDPEFLSSMKGLIETFPFGGIYGCAYYLVKNSKAYKAPIGIEPEFKCGEFNYLEVYAKKLCMPLTSISVIIPKKIFKELQGFKPNLKLGEDFDLWLRITLAYSVYFLNKPLAYYNQDVELSNRGIGKLHKPEHHILWNLEFLSDEETKNPSLKQLLDNLRVSGLYPYFLTRKYVEKAKKELVKVDWTNQPKSIYRKYKMPVFLLRGHFYIMKLGSRVKQKLAKIRN
jgi:glycosyltransferase involved in cell wall biosynthesis